MIQLRFFSAALCTFSALGLVGCSATNEPPPPPTHTVQGKVVQKDGTPYTQGANIIFRSTKDPDKTTSGEIRDDGSFSLHTIVGNRSVPGAQEGEHTVTVFPKMKDQTGGPIDLQKKYTIKAGENKDFVVKLE